MINRFLAVLPFLVVVPLVFGQTSDVPELGDAYAHLVSFEAEPEIAAATFTIDNDDPSLEDAELDVLKLPLYHEFGSDQQDWRWFAQGALSYMTFKERFYLDRQENDQQYISARWKGYGAMVEGGVILPLQYGFSLAPSLGLGLSRLENDLRLAGFNPEAALSPQLDGTVFNWDTLAGIIRAHVGLLYDQKHGAFRFKGAGHLSYAYVDSFNESTGFSGFASHTSTATVKLDVSHPLATTLRGYPMFVVAHIGGTAFLGSGRGQLGFDSFGELGASVGAGKITVGLMGILGDNVSGGTVVFNYDY